MARRSRPVLLSMWSRDHCVGTCQTSWCLQIQPWPVWLRGLERFPCTRGCLIPLRAQAYVAGSIPGVNGRQPFGISPIDAPLPQLPKVNKSHLQNETQIHGHHTDTLNQALRQGPEVRICRFESTLHSTPRQYVRLRPDLSGSAGRSPLAKLTSEQRGRTAVPLG